MVKLMWCPKCRRLCWARLKDMRWICTECGEEITYSEISGTSFSDWEGEVQVQDITEGGNDD